MIKKLKNFMQDNSGAGTGSMIASVLTVMFAVTVGALVVTLLKTATDTTFTNMIDHLTDIGNSGY